MMIDIVPKISFQCPVCENYYYGSTFCSGNTFGATYYTDGSMDSPYLPRESFITQCPKCKTFLDKRFLKPMKNQIRLVFDFKERAELMPRPSKSKNPDISFKETPELKKKLETAGHVDDHFRSDAAEAAFLEEALAKGLYYPERAPEWLKEDYNKRKRKSILQDLWHCYNRDRTICSKEKYEKLCKQYISFLHEYDDKERLCLAELYRNIGEFEKSKDLLQGFRSPEKYKDYIDCILKEIEKKNTYTVALP